MLTRLPRYFRTLKKWTKFSVQPMRSGESPFWAVRPQSSGGVEGWLSLHDIYPMDGAIEIGAWHSILVDEWPARRAAISAWLADENFDERGRAHARLQRPGPG